MARWTAQNESAHPGAPSSDYVRLYPYGDELYFKDDAGNLYKVVSVVDNGMELNASDFVYLGDSGTNGTWRIGRSGDNLVFERRESDTWVEKFSMQP